MIVRGIEQLKANYHKLRAGDIVVGIIPSNYLKSTMLVDLLECQVQCFPSAISQVLNSSKASQAMVLNEYMLPYTIVISRRAQLLKAVNLYNELNIAAVVTKNEHMHGGHGIRRWESLEMLYSCISMSETDYPFILQPYIQDIVDVRVIVVEDYIEAYQRFNPHNFRNNLSVGGVSRPYHLSVDETSFCRDVIKRAKYPYAHIDLQKTPGGDFYLSEITFNGGIKGARIDRKSLDEKKQAVMDRWIRSFSGHKEINNDNF